MRKLSIRNRTRWALVLLASFVAGLNLWFLAGVSKWSEDYILEQLLQRELTFVKGHLDHEGNLPPRSSSLFQAYTDTSQLPAPMQVWLNELDLGEHEAEDDEQGFSAMAVVFHHPVLGRVYLAGDVSEAEYLESNKATVFQFALLSFGISILIAYLISGYLSDRTIHPLRQLESKVAATSYRDAELKLSEIHASDEIGRLARAFEVARADLAQFARREQSFTADVSHELRTPLMSASNALQLLQQNGESRDERETRYLERIERGLRKMQSLVTTFLELAREESLQTKPSEIEVWPLIEDAFQAHRELYPHKTLRLVKVGEPNATVKGPTQLIGILVSNLIGNAIQYSVREDITAKLNPTANGLEISLTNDTHSTQGIDFEPLAKRFVRGERKQNGYGIGLSIAKRICELLDWKMTLKAASKNQVVACIVASN